MRFIVLTNNPDVLKIRGVQTQFIDGSYREVLVAVRNLCHQGHTLLSHPLSGSVKPNETPYKSVLVSVQEGSTDLESVELIEDAIRMCDHFPERREKWTEDNLKDYRLVDKELISSAIESATVCI